MKQSLTTRLVAWQIPLVTALALLILWLALPALDLRVPGDPDDPFGNPLHFWMIAASGLISLVMGILMSGAAQRRNDTRLFLIALAVLSAAAAFMLHGLATPNVLVTGRNIGFVVAAPAGLIVASFFAAASAPDRTAEQAAALLRYRGLLRNGLLGFWVVFGAMALLKLPPLSLVPDPETANTPLFFCLVGPASLPAFQYPVSILLIGSALLYGWAAQHYMRLFFQRGTVVLLGLTTALLGLSFITLNVGLSRTWHLSWWHWHVLILVAFGLLAFSAYRQFRSEGSGKIIFDSVYLEETIRQIREEYTGALESLVEAIQRRAAEGDNGAPVSVAVAERFGLSDGQVRVLERAAEALAHEREQIERLGALVAVGQETSVIMQEHELLQRALSLAGGSFSRERLRIGLVSEGRLDFPAMLQGGLSEAPPFDAELRRELVAGVIREANPAERGGFMVLPLTVKGRVAGVLEVQRTSGEFAERDRWLLRSLASQLSVALENARLYRQIDSLFRQYMPASVATALIADPSQAALGGAVREISVMFGDLRGFTSLSERLSPPELVKLLNRYYGAASAVVLEQGGTIDKFMGDAMMALFNAPSHQPDHALRACRAALLMQQAIAPIAAEAGDMPRFGIGINTGEALVGNIGSEAIRNFTAIGDTVNLSSRLQSRAQGGQVLISAGTYNQVRDHVIVEPLGEIQVKGKAEPVVVYILKEIRG